MIISCPVERRKRIKEEFNVGIHERIDDIKVLESAAKQALISIDGPVELKGLV